MADAEKNIKVKMGAEDNTGTAFKSVGKNIQILQGSTASLSAGLTKLGMVGAALFAGRELLSFFGESIRLALEDETATFRLTAALKKLGIQAVAPELDSFINKMVKLGQGESETTAGLTRFIQSTGSAKQAIYLSTLATELAASGMGTYSGNVEALNSLLLGRTRAALATFGIETEKNIEIVDALDKIESKLTVTTSTMLDTMGGKLKSASTQWDEFKSHVGAGLLNIGNWFAGPFNTVINDIERWMGKTKEQTQTTEEQEKAVLAEGKAEVIAGAQREAALKAQEEAADKTADAFRTLSKNIVSSFKDQQKAIAELKSTLADLDEQLNEDIAKSDENYQKDVANLARAAKERVDEIDRQIADEKSSMSQGWRGRIADLEAERAKENDILAKAASKGIDIQTETKKDEFDLLAESHANELKEMQDAAEKKKLETNKEILERQKFLLESGVAIAKPGFFEKATAEETSFLGAIGAGTTQQSFVFNFNGAVAGDEGIKKIIQQMIDELNRQATLRGIGGK